MLFLYLFQDKETRLRAELKSRAANEPDEDFTGRIKDIEEKLLKGSNATQKKPKDLLRAIGKIEKTDWNVKEIEKKIEENKYGRKGPHERPEKVPKWSRQHFDDKVNEFLHIFLGLIVCFGAFIKRTVFSFRQWKESF